MYLLHLRVGIHIHVATQNVILTFFLNPPIHLWKSQTLNKQNLPANGVWQ